LKTGDPFCIDQHIIENLLQYGVNLGAWTLLHSLAMFIHPGVGHALLGLVDNAVREETAHEG